MALNISKFLDQFFMEAKEKLADIQNHMVELENNPRDKDAVLVIQRGMHTIKGSARMVGLTGISDIAHLMEEIFLKLQTGEEVPADVMTVLYRGVDGVAEGLRLAEAKKESPDSTRLLDELRAVINGKPAPGGAAAREDTPPGDGAAAGDDTVTGDDTTAIDTPPGDPNAEVTSKRQFKLDFNTLKKKFEGKIPSIRKTGEEAEAAPPPEPPEPAEAKKPAKKKKAAPPPEPAVEPAPVRETPPEPDTPPAREAPATESAHLKVSSGAVETIINQVTDLLSRRYFFSNVLQTTRELSRMTRGLLKEWQGAQTHDSGMLKGYGEAAANIDNTLDLFTKKLQDFDRDYQVHLANFEGAMRDVYDNLLELKLTPLTTIFNIYPRFVRDYAYRSGKKIRIYVRGGDTYLDKTVIEKINEPLIHLIRNACDHGIESPETREKKGKSPTGTIIIEAAKKGNRVEIIVKDDGRGLDKEKILAKIKEKQWATPDEAERMHEQEVFEFIFRPGFSTTTEISDISGRGMGMEIVQRVVRQFGGSVNVETQSTAGAVFRLEFPISISTHQVTYIKEEGRIYAVPGNLIRRIVKLSPDDIKEKADYSVVVFNDEIYTVAKLNQVLSGGTAGLGTSSIFMLLPKVTDKKTGIIVDEILHEAEVIIKSPGRFLGKCKYVYGLVIGERGELHTVLDLHDVMASHAFSRKIKIITPFTPAPSEKPRILVVDDSLLVREMERNILEHAGYNVTVAINGLDGYNKALSRPFDLIMADIEMPEMDGLEMLENIKKIEAYVDTPTIVLSSVEREDFKTRAINMGVNAWLQKQHFDRKETLKTVKRFLG